MFEFSIGTHFAFMFAVLFVANREFGRLKNIQTMPWKDIFFATAEVALLTFVAGHLFYGALLEIVTGGACG